MRSAFIAASSTRLVAGAGEDVVAGLYNDLRHGASKRSRSRCQLSTKARTLASNVLRVLLIGCGDVALRAAALLRGRVRLLGLIRKPQDAPKLRAHGIVPIVGDLDDFRTLERLSASPYRGAAFRAAARRRSRRSAHAKASRCAREGAAGYHSDSSTFRRRACTAIARGARDFRRRGRAARRRRAAKRRVAAEDRLRHWAARYGVTATILRVPGIYATTRLPLDRIRQQTPVLAPDDDVYTNHIHADDLARATVAALFRGRPNRAYNVTDDAEMKMGGWFDAVADAFQLPRPPRVSWEEAEAADRAAAAVVHERVAPARPTRA